MHMYVVYGTVRGRAKRAAEAIADAAATRGVATLVRSVNAAVPGDLVTADLLIAGCGTRVDTPGGGEPAQRLTSWSDGLPELDGLPIGVFCTYTFFPHTFADTAARTAGVLNRLERAFYQKGGKVVGSRSFHAREFTASSTELVGKAVDHAPV